MGDATLRLARRRSGWAPGFAALAHTGEAWNVAVDGAVVGAIDNGETVEVFVEPGRHTLRLGQRRHLSAPRSFEVADDEVVSFHCDVHHLWPILLAAQFKPDLWISLRRG